MRYAIVLTMLLALPAVAAEQVGVLPEPVTNNAVASAETENGTTLYSFAGLSEGKTWSDTHARSFAFDLETGTARQLADVPGDVGRLAAVAATVNGQIYFFGGYTVAEDGSEVSTPETFAFDPVSEIFQTRAPMPVPTDDAVALTYQDRYIYLISGWHNSGNINLSQVYDTETDSWFQATPFPGAPVFGNAGGIVDRQFVVGGGVRITNADDGSRDFVMSGEYWHGEISETNPARIRWRPLPGTDWPARYRMAATGATDENVIVFVGGSTNPYNYDGIGYNGEPSAPETMAFGWDLTNNWWVWLGDIAPATMDHRGLLFADGNYYVLGGMRDRQAVSSAVQRVDLSFPDQD